MANPSLSELRAMLASGRKVHPRTGLAIEKHIRSEEAAMRRALYRAKADIARRERTLTKLVGGVDEARRDYLAAKAKRRRRQEAERDSWSAFLAEETTRVAVPRGARARQRKLRMEELGFTGREMGYG